MGARSPIRFGVFEIDIDAEELRKSGVRIKLEQQPLTVLLLLLDRPGEVVTREEIIARLWPTGVHVDFDRSLNKAVVKLREALGDLAESPRFIETKPRQGYRFIAPVERVAERREAPPVTGSIPAAAPKKSRLRIWTVSVAIMIALAAATVWRLSVNRPAPPHVRSIAVLPLKNLSGDPNQEYLASGMTEALTTGLAQIGSIEVRTTRSVTQERVSGKTTREIARELKVDAVVEGSVQRSNERVLITAQLIEASTERHLWARSYEGRVQNALSLQNEVARDIAQEIRVKLTPQEQSQLSKTSSADPKAQEAYLRGQFELKNLVPDKALKYFQEATEKDSEFAAAWAAQSECYGLLILSGVLPGTEARPRWRSAVTRALELDNTSAEAHHSLAVLLNYNDWNWDEAEREFQTAIRLNPNHALAHLWYGDNLMNRGRMDEATREIVRANQLDPFSVTTNTMLALVLFMSRRYDEALEQANKLAELQKDWNSAHHFKGVIYEQQGKFEQAIAEHTWPSDWDENKVPFPFFGKLIADLAHTYASAGKKKEALRLLNKLEQLSKRRNISSFSFALIYAGLGDTDRAFEWLAKGYDERPSEIAQIKVDPRMDPLRTDPRYSEMLRRMGLPQ